MCVCVFIRMYFLFLFGHNIPFMGLNVPTAFEITRGEGVFGIALRVRVQSILL